MNIDQFMNNSLIVAQYNILIQKAESCLNERVSVGNYAD